MRGSGLGLLGQRVGLLRRIIYLLRDLLLLVLRLNILLQVGLGCGGGRLLRGLGKLRLAVGQSLGLLCRLALRAVGLIDGVLGLSSLLLGQVGQVLGGGGEGLLGLTSLALRGILFGLGRLLIGLDRRSPRIGVVLGCLVGRLLDGIGQFLGLLIGRIAGPRRGLVLVGRLIDLFGELVGLIFEILRLGQVLRVLGELVLCPSAPLPGSRSGEAGDWRRFH